MSRVGRATKRGVEVVLTAAVLAVASPLILAVAIVLKCVGEHRVFYRQERIGLGGRPFDLLKFTTMYDRVSQRADGGMALDSDPEVFPFGRFLRKTKLNEVPQLLNVLKGDMALVGPRPLTQKTFSKYPVGVQANLSTIRPGLTGAASVVFRSEEALLAKARGNKARLYDEVIVPHKALIESWYVDNWSLLLDLKILFATAVAVLNPRSDLPLGILPPQLRQPPDLDAWFPGEASP